MCGPEKRLLFIFTSILVWLTAISSNGPSDTGLSRQADMRNRSIRVRNLPPGTQEGLLQQTLEKYAVIKRVEIFQEKNEAVAELENAAVSLLLPPWGLQFLFILFLYTGGRKAFATLRSYHSPR